MVCKISADLRDPEQVLKVLRKPILSPMLHLLCTPDHSKLIDFHKCIGLHTHLSFSQQYRYPSSSVSQTSVYLLGNAIKLISNTMYVHFHDSKGCEC